jgi:hypothetical protein
VRSRRQELGLRLGHADEGSRVAATAVFVQKEAPSAGPDIWAGYAANSRPNPPIQVERGEPFGLDHVSGSGGTQAKAVGLPPASYRPARHGLLFHTDGHYVDPASSRKRAPAPTGLAEHAYTAVGPRVRLATCCTSSIQTVSVGLGKTRTSGTSASLTAYRTG